MIRKQIVFQLCREIYFKLEFDYGKSSLQVQLFTVLVDSGLFLLGNYLETKGHNFLQCLLSKEVSTGDSITKDELINYVNNSVNITVLPNGNTKRVLFELVELIFVYIQPGNMLRIYENESSQEQEGVTTEN